MATSFLHVPAVLVLCLVSFCTQLLGCTQQKASGEHPTTVVVVRHAEEELDERDPGLTPAGRDRAGLLAYRCADAGVSAVFSTPYNRTLQTANPTADRLGLTVDTTFKPHEEGALGAHIRSSLEGQAVLVVGHSNTVPLILAGLGAPRIADLPETAYDRLYIVTIARDGTVIVDEQRYGTPTPP